MGLFTTSLRIHYIPGIYKDLKCIVVVVVVVVIVVVVVVVVIVSVTMELPCVVSK
jgi:hypothetical protein